MSLVILMVCEMEIQVLSYKNSFQSLEDILAFDTLSDRFKDRFGHYETHTVPRISTMIDPRFKKQGFQRTNNADQACRALEDDLQNVLNKLAQEQSTAASMAPTPPNSTNSSYFKNLQLRLNNIWKAQTSQKHVIP